MASTGKIGEPETQACASGSYLNLEDLHHWFVEEQRRIQALDLDLPQKQAKLLDLQELYLSISNRFLGEPANNVVPMVAPKEIGLLVNRDSPPTLPPQAKAE